MNKINDSKLKKVNGGEAGVTQTPGNVVVTYEICPHCNEYVKINIDGTCPTCHKMVK